MTILGGQHHLAYLGPMVVRVDFEHARLGMGLVGTTWSGGEGGQEVEGEVVDRV